MNSGKLLMANTAGKFYQPELDGLRFFAFLGVFLQHTLPATAEAYARHPRFPHSLIPFALSVPAAGAYGVDLFFVLSSYLITELLLRERAASGTVHVKHFYIRRAFRIWPLYLLFLILSVGIASFDPAQRFGGRYLLAYAFFVGNWACVWWGWPASIAVPLWSISVEEQFYFFWPLTMRHLSEKRIIWAAGALLVVSSATRLGLAWAGAGHVAIWANTLARLDPIAAGALLAITLRHRAPKLQSAVRAALLAGGLAVLLLVARYCPLGDARTHLRGLFIGYPTIALACAVILVSVLRSAGQPSWLFKNRLTIYLGRISYGLYVFHSLGLYLGERLRSFLPQSFPGLYAMAASFALTIALAAASYHVLEKPFVRLKHRFTYVESGM